MDYSSMETPTSICWGNYHLSAFAQPQPNLKQNYQLWNFKISFSQRSLKPSKPFTVEDASTLLFQSGLEFLRLNEVTHCHQVKINYYFSLEKPQCIHSATLYDGALPSHAVFGMHIQIFIHHYGSILITAFLHRISQQRKIRALPLHLASTSSSEDEKRLLRKSLGFICIT